MAHLLIRFNVYVRRAETERGVTPRVIDAFRHYARTLEQRIERGAAPDAKGEERFTWGRISWTVHDEEDSGDAQPDAGAG